MAGVLALAGVFGVAGLALTADFVTEALAYDLATEAFLTERLAGLALAGVAFTGVAFTGEAVLLLAGDLAGEEVTDFLTGEDFLLDLLGDLFAGEAGFDGLFFAGDAFVGLAFPLFLGELLGAGEAGFELKRTTGFTTGDIRMAWKGSGSDISTF